jgi:AraC-like DNA-binding protein
MDPALARTSSALDDLLSNLPRRPALSDLEERLALSPRQIERNISALGTLPAHRLSFRDALRRWRTMMACLALASDDGPSLADVARATGYGSAIALCHAFTRQNLPPPSFFRRSAL